MKEEKKESVGYTTVRMTTTTHKTISKEAKRLGLKNIDYIDAAVRYFSLRGLNPEEVEAREGTLIIQQIQRLGERLFSYMQAEEKNILGPMLEELIRIRLTTERVLRLEEVVLSSIPEEEIKSKKGAVEQLRTQSTAAIDRQMKAALEGNIASTEGRKLQKNK